MRLNLNYLFLTVFSLVFFGFIYLVPGLFGGVGLFQKIRENKITETRLETKIETIRAGAESLNQIRPELPLLETAFPNRHQPSDLLKEINQTFGRFQVFVADLRFEEKPPPLAFGVTQVPFLAVVTGSYSGFIQALAELERLPHYYTISNLYLSRLSNRPGIEASLKLTSYIFPFGDFCPEKNDESK